MKPTYDLSVFLCRGLIATPKVAGARRDA